MRKLFTFSLLFIVFQSFAQQGLQMDFAEPDSAAINLQRQIDYFNLLTGSFNTGIMNEKLDLSANDFTNEFSSPYQINFEFFPQNNQISGGFYPGMFHAVYSPFLRNAEVLSSAAYKLGEKFVLGGFSYGTNSILSAPFPNQGKGGFDSYGSTLFMQYKVSKKIKIETRVNVSKGGHHPGF